MYQVEEEEDDPKTKPKRHTKAMKLRDGVKMKSFDALSLCFPQRGRGSSQSIPNLLESDHKRPENEKFGING